MTGSVLFVSHVSEDRAPAMEFVEELERQGVKCWIAPRDVRPGGRFDDQIADAIDSCAALLLIFSERCNNNEYIYREVTVAGEAKKPIIPIRIDNSAPRRGLRMRLTDLHWIDGHEEREPAIEAIITTLRARPKDGADAVAATADRDAGPPPSSKAGNDLRSAVSMPVEPSVAPETSAFYRSPEPAPPSQSVQVPRGPAEVSLDRRSPGPASAFNGVGVWTTLTSPNGRIARRGWWIGVVVIAVYGGVLAILVGENRTVGTKISATSLVVMTVGVIPMIYVYYCISAKRFRDRDRTGGLALVGVALAIVLTVASLIDPNGASALFKAATVALGAVNIWFLIELGCLPGTTGPNQYGPDPLGRA